MEQVTILYHPGIEEAAPLAAQVKAWLQQRGVAGHVAAGDDLEEPAVQEEVAQSDLAIVLGGDGSTLRAARVTSCYDVPIFGINLGRVGFLSEASPADWRGGWPAFSTGRDGWSGG